MKQFSDFMDYCRCGHPGFGCYCWEERQAEAERYYQKYLDSLDEQRFVDTVGDDLL